MLNVESYFKELTLMVMEDNDISPKNMTIDLNSSFVNDLKFTSLMFAQIIMQLQDVTNLNPFDEGVEISDIKTLGDLAKVYKMVE